MANEFILHLDHEALKYIQGQHKLNSRHTRWVEYLKSLHLTIKHKFDKLNQGADASCRRHLLLFLLDACILEFQHLKSLSTSDENFGELYLACLNHPKDYYLIHNWYLFKATRLCIPKCGTRELLIREICGGSSADHFGDTKTLVMFREHYCWCGMSKDV